MRFDLLDQLLVGGAGLRRDRDLVELPRLVEEALSVLQVEPRQRRAADRADRAEPDDAGELQLLLRPRRLDADLLADGQVLLLHRRLVHHDLARPRPVALDERERIELRGAVRDAEAEIRRTAVDDRLPVLPDQVGLAVHARLRRLHAGEGANLCRERLVEGRFRRRAVRSEIEGGFAADHGVRALARVGEDRVERRVDRIRQHVRAADHRDAEHDRDRRQRGAKLPTEQALQRELGHVSSSLIALRISSWLDFARSRTTRPSARKRTRSAIVAARGSCVTITIVWP